MVYIYIYVVVSLLVFVVVVVVFGVCVWGGGLSLFSCCFVCFLVVFKLDKQERV